MAILTALNFNASLISPDIFSLTSLPGNDEQNTESRGMPVFEKKSVSISATTLSVDLWLIKMVGFISTSLTFPAYLIGI